MSDTGKETFLNAALYYNPQLKQDIEQWITEIVMRTLQNASVMDAALGYNQTIVRRHVHNAIKDIHQRIDNYSYNFF